MYNTFCRQCRRQSALRKKSREIQDGRAGILKRVKASDRKMELVISAVKKNRRNGDKSIA